jgi:hypothetical protein
MEKKSKKSAVFLFGILHFFEGTAADFGSFVPPPFCGLFNFPLLCLLNGFHLILLLITFFLCYFAPNNKQVHTSHSQMNERLLSFLKIGEFSLGVFNHISISFTNPP